MCLDAKSSKEKEAKVFECHSNGGHQYWEYDNGKICRGNYCVHFEDPKIFIRHQSKKVKKSQVSPFLASEIKFSLNNSFVLDLDLPKRNEAVSA